MDIFVFNCVRNRINRTKQSKKQKKSITMIRTTKMKFTEMITENESKMHWNRDVSKAIEFTNMHTHVHTHIKHFCETLITAGMHEMCQNMLYTQHAHTYTVRRKFNEDGSFRIRRDRCPITFAKLYDLCVLNHFVLLSAKIKTHKRNKLTVNSCKKNFIMRKKNRNHSIALEMLKHLSRDKNNTFQDKIILMCECVSVLLKRFSIFF